MLIYKVTIAKFGVAEYVRQKTECVGPQKVKFE